LPAYPDVNLAREGVVSDKVADLYLLLVGPGGQLATVMSDSGLFGNIAVDLVLDDEAPTPLPDLSTALTTGTYAPTNYGSPDAFPAPAPAATGAAALSVFDGLDPNGTWSLYAVDDVITGETRLSGWSLEFSWADVQSPGGSIAVDGGAAVTSTTAVTLDLNASDPVPASGVTQMRFSNDGTSFSAYQPYAASAMWTLMPGSGTKTVYAQFVDAEGNTSAIVSDTIKLDDVGPRAKRVDPSKGAKDVSTRTKIKIRASEKLAKITVTKKTVVLKQRGAPGRVAVRITYDASTRTIVVSPKRRLRGETAYAVKVKAVEDVAGNRWDEKRAKPGPQPLTYTFTTRA
jgi:hypothetical protein